MKALPGPVRGATAARVALGAVAGGGAGALRAAAGAAEAEGGAGAAEPDARGGAEAGGAVLAVADADAEAAAGGCGGAPPSGFDAAAPAAPANTIAAEAAQSPRVQSRERIATAEPPHGPGRGARP